MIANITRDVPKAAVSAIPPMFNQLRDSLNTRCNRSPIARMEYPSFDWALHPGGSAILGGAQKSLQLTDDHIRASLDVYQSFGNSSSPTVLIVLDKLRGMGDGRDHVVATSFGPGLIIEMCLMRRCRDVPRAQPLGLGFQDKLHRFWLSLQFKLRTIEKKTALGRRLSTTKSEYRSVV